MFKSCNPFPKLMDEGWKATAWLFEMVRICPPVKSMVNILGYNPAASTAWTSEWLAELTSNSGGTMTKRILFRLNRALLGCQSIINEQVQYTPIQLLHEVLFNFDEWWIYQVARYYEHMNHEAMCEGIYPKNCWRSSSICWRFWWLKK